MIPVIIERHVTHETGESLLGSHAWSLYGLNELIHALALGTFQLQLSYLRAAIRYALL